MQNVKPVVAGKQYIYGEWVEGLKDGLTSISPISNTAIWQGKCANTQQVSLAVNSAQLAFKSWRTKALSKRIAVVKKFKALLVENAEKLAEIICIETGKALWESKQEVAAMAGKIDISIEAYHQRTGEKISEAGAVTSMVKHKPHGVVAVYGPYNFPGHLPNGHIVPALIAGNTAVFKPSEQTPWVAQEMVKLWDDAGLPAGVINLIFGCSDVGKQLAAETNIDGLFFTGSSQVGTSIHQTLAGSTNKIIALEMGGNNPLVVGQYQNTSATVYTIIQSAFITAGQRCTCARRLFVPADREGDDLLQALIAATKQIKVGDPTSSEQPFMGPVISNHVAKQLLSVQSTLISKGAKALCMMIELKPDSAFLSPGILDMTNCSEKVDEEFFGPLLQVYRYDSFEHAVEMANDTKFGLSAGLLSEKPQHFSYFYDHIEAGIVNWNKPTTGASSSAPFGGVGESGNHRPSAYYAADYCAYPVASVMSDTLELPEQLSPGITI